MGTFQENLSTNFRATRLTYTDTPNWNDDIIAAVKWMSYGLDSTATANTAHGGWLSIRLNLSFKPNFGQKHWRQPRRGCRGHIPPPIFFGWGDVNGNIPPILLRTFAYSRTILVALRSLSLKPISFGYKTPQIRFSQAGGQSAHKARPHQPWTRVDATVNALKNSSPFNNQKDASQRKTTKDSEGRAKKHTMSAKNTFKTANIGIYP